MSIRVVGSVVMDLISHVELLPKLGETLIVNSSLSMRIGGKGLNQACSIARSLGSGESILFEGAIGNDLFGKVARNTLNENKIQHYLQTIENQSTGTGSIYLQNNGDNCIVVSSGANSYFDASQRKSLANTKFVISQLELPLSVTLDYFRDLKSDTNTIRVLNASPIPKSLVRNATFQQVLNCSDLIVLNRVEAEALCETRQSVESLGQEILRTKAKNAFGVVITLGKNGAVVVQRTEENTCKVISVRGTSNIAVDAVGAGDCFLGSLIANLFQGSNLEESVLHANKDAGQYVQEIKLGLRWNDLI